MDQRRISRQIRQLRVRQVPRSLLQRSNGGGLRPDASTPGRAAYHKCRAARIPGHSSDAVPRPGHGPLTSLLGAGTGLPSLPSWRWWQWVSDLGIPGAAGWFGRFPGRGYATDGGFDFGGDSAGGAVVGDGFRARVGCWRDGGGRGSACAAGTDDTVGGAGGERPDIGGAGGGAGFCSDTGVRRQHPPLPGCTGGWSDAVWVGAAAAAPPSAPSAGSVPAPPSIPAEGGGGSVSTWAWGWVDAGCWSARRCAGAPRLGGVRFGAGPDGGGRASGGGELLPIRAWIGLWPLAVTLRRG